MDGIYYYVDENGAIYNENNGFTDDEGNIFIEREEVLITAPGPSPISLDTREGQTCNGAALRSNPSSSKLTWTRSNTLLLLETYKKFRKDLTSNKIKRDEAWKNVASQMTSNGVEICGEQCKWKFNKMKGKYVKKKDNKGPGSSGASRYDFEFFEEMEEIFRNCPAVHPLEMCGNRRAPLLSQTGHRREIPNEVAEAVGCNSDIEEEREPQPPPKKKKKNINLLIEHHERLENLKEEEMLKTEEFRSKMLSSVNNLTESMNRNCEKFSNLMEKIIDKL